MPRYLNWDGNHKTFQGAEQQVWKHPWKCLSPIRPISSVVFNLPDFLSGELAPYHKKVSIVDVA